MATENAAIRRALNPVMLELGATVYICQLLENTLTFLHELIDSDEGVAASVPRVPPLYGRKTLRPLLTLLQQRIAVPERTVDALLLAVETRNSVVHRYLTDRVLALRTKEGRGRIVEELRRLRNEIRAADKRACELVDRYLKKYGTSTELLKRSISFFPQEH